MRTAAFSGSALPVMVTSVPPARATRVGFIEVTEKIPTPG
jgi:hypothetical protein